MKVNKKTIKAAVLAAALTIGSLALLHTTVEKAVIPFSQEDYLTLKPTETEEEVQDQEELLRQQKLEEEAAAKAAEEQAAKLKEQIDAVRDIKNDIKALYKNGSYTKKSIITGMKAYLSKDTIKMIVVKKDSKINYLQYYYYVDDQPVYIYYEGDDAWAFYLQDDELFAVRYWEVADGDTYETYDSSSFTSWYNTVVETARNDLTTAYSKLKLASLESSAKKQEQKDISKSDDNIKVVTREESEKNAPKTSGTTTAQAAKTEAEKTGTSTTGTASSGSSKTGTSSTGTTVTEIFPDSSTKSLKKSDLKGLTKDQLQLAVNEIYARNGYKFKDKDLLNHFKQFSWYKPDTSDATKVEKRFNKTEQANLKLMREYKEEKGY